ncbi:tubulin delta chain isoform X10 [Pan troglodytes]
MEPKVINQTLSKAAQSGQWKYGQHACFCQKQGSGNNWAYGYSVHGPRHEESIMNIIRKEVEKCDSFSGFFIIMSMAGGTGSGLGAFVTQNLEDQYSNSLKMNQIIWPYGTGEVIVQNYNSILTLSHLYRSSDALLLHENDAIHKICAKLMNIKQISFSDINQVLAHQLGSVFQPTYSAESSFHYRRNPLGIDRHVRPPLSGLPPLSKMSLNKDLHFNTSIANLVILRGKDVQSADVEGFKDPALYTSWLKPVNAFNVWKTQRAFSKYEKSAVLVSNSQFLVKPLDMIVGKAWNMFASKAYIHQYTKFGIEEEDFLDSFTSLEQVVASYCNL